MSASWTSIPDGALATPDLFNSRFDALNKGNVFNVLSYGDVSGGTLDAVSAITSAMAAAAPSRGKVYFPPGTYAIGSMIQVSDEGIAFEGVGRGSRLSATTGLQAVLYVDARDVTIKGLRVSGTSCGAANALGSGIQLASTATDATIRECHIDSCGGVGGIYKAGGGRLYGLRLLNNSLRSNTGMEADLTDSHADIYINSTSSTFIQGNNCESRTGFGIIVFDGQNVEITGNIVRNKSIQSLGPLVASGYGITTYDTTGTAVQNVTIADNIIEFCETIGIYVQSGHRILVQGNQVRSSSSGSLNPSLLYGGISISNPQTAVCVGNIVTDSQAADGAIAVTQNAETLGNVVVSGNVIDQATEGIVLSDASGVVVQGNSVSRISNGRGISATASPLLGSIIQGNNIFSATNPGIELIAGAVDCQVAGNSVTSCYGGINLLSTTTRCQVNGNIIRDSGGTGAGTRVALAATLVSSVVANNIISSTTAYSTGISIGSGSTGYVLQGNIVADSQTTLSDTGSTVGAMFGNVGPARSAATVSQDVIYSGVSLRNPRVSTSGNTHRLVYESNGTTFYIAPDGTL